MRTKVTRVVLLLTCIVVQRVTFAANVNDFIDFSLVSGTTVLLPGRLYVPPQAMADTGSAHPLILFLHGSGQSGTNNLSQIDSNIDNLLAEAKQRGAFLYAPQSLADWSSAALTGQVIAMIDRATVERNADNYRLYVTGVSMGGGGTWNMLTRYDNRFAAALPISGVAPAADFMAKNLIDEAIVAFHSRDDSVVSVANTRSIVNRILTAAGETVPTYPSSSDPPLFVYSSSNLDLTYVELSMGDHVIWPAVYSIPEVYDWMFAHALPEPSTFVFAALALPFLGIRRFRVFVASDF